MAFKKVGLNPTFVEASEGGIIVHIFSDYSSQPSQPQTHCYKNFGSEYKAEEICIEICKDLKVGPIATHLFALKCKGSEIWLAPNTVIPCTKEKKQQYEFRIRFIPSAEGIKTLTRLAKEALGYLFLQCRQDFVDDHISFQDSIGQDRILGLAVIDIVRWGKENGLDKEKVLRLSATDFLPPSAKKKFNFVLNALRLNNNVKSEVTKIYDDDEMDSLPLGNRKRYFSGLLQYAKDYGSETYTTTDERTILYRPKDNQIYWISKSDRDKKDRDEEICSVEDIMSVDVRDGSSVHICLRSTGAPIMLSFRDEVICKSFVSLLDGYHRMTADFHYCIDSQVFSPIVKLLEAFRSHGCVSLQWAQRRLLDKHHQISQFNYLVKQSQQDYDQFTLIYLPQQANECQSIIIKKSGENWVMANFEREFRSPQELMRFLMSDNNGLSVKLNRYVRPDRPLDSCIYLCQDVSRVSPSNTDIDDNTDKNSVKCISGLNVTASQVFASGAFGTQIFEVMWTKDKRLTKVACKRLMPSVDKHLLKYFADGVHVAASWKSPHIISIYAVCLSPFQVIMELAPLGSMEAILEKEGDYFKDFQLLSVVDQLAMALMYLEKLRLPDVNSSTGLHGNIRCRSILVMSRDSRGLFTVKLSDPGLVTFYNQCVPMDAALNVERLPWLAPEFIASAFDSNSITSSADIYSYGVTVVELFLRGQRPLPENGAFVLIQVLFKDGVPIPDNIPADLKEVVRKCLSRNPDDRPSAESIVRDLSRMALKSNRGATYHEIDEQNDGISAQTTQSFVVNWDSNETSQLCSKAKDIVENHKKKLEELEKVSGSSSFVGIDALLTPSNVDWNLSDLQPETARVTSRVKHGGQDNPGYEPSVYNIDEKRLNVLKDTVLGKGYYGKVYLGEYTKSGVSEKVAVKELTKVTNNSYDDDLIREYKMMAQLKHPNIVLVKGLFPTGREDAPYYLVMEYADKGSLKLFLRTMYKDQGKKFPQHENKVPADDAQYNIKLLTFATDIAEGMKYLHSQKVVHRDLAARNILVSKDETAKISDFGLARNLKKEFNMYLYEMSDPTKPLPMFWCAPESIEFHKFHPESDIWSFAVTIWEVFHCGQEPKIVHDKKIEQLLSALKEPHNKRLPKPKFCTENLYQNLLMACWKFNKDERPKWTQILQLLEEETKQYKDRYEKERSA